MAKYENGEIHSPTHNIVNNNGERLIESEGFLQAVIPIGHLTNPVPVVKLWFVTGTDEKIYIDHTSELDKLKCDELNNKKR